MIGAGALEAGASGDIMCSVRKMVKSGLSIAKVLRNEEFDRCNQAYRINSLSKTILINFVLYSLCLLT